MFIFGIYNGFIIFSAKYLICFRISRKYSFTRKVDKLVVSFYQNNNRTNLFLPKARLLDNKIYTQIDFFFLVRPAHFLSLMI